MRRFLFLTLVVYASNKPKLTYPPHLRTQKYRCLTLKSLKNERRSRTGRKTAIAKRIVFQANAKKTPKKIVGSKDFMKYGGIDRLLQLKNNIPWYLTLSDFKNKTFFLAISKILLGGRFKNGQVSDVIQKYILNVLNGKICIKLKHRNKTEQFMCDLQGLF